MTTNILLVCIIALLLALLLEAKRVAGSVKDASGQVAFLRASMIDLLRGLHSEQLVAHETRHNKQVEMLNAIREKASPEPAPVSSVVVDHLPLADPKVLRRGH